MFTLALKVKLMAAILGASASAAKVQPGSYYAYGPTNEGRYAALGAGFIPTHDCTVTADGMHVVLSPNGQWLMFLDRSGETEAECQIGERPVLATPVAISIPRAIAVVQ